MATADELIVRIKGDLSDITKKLKQLEQSTSTTTSKVSKNFNRIASVAKVAVGAVVVTQVARAGAALVNFGSHVEEMQAKSSVVFGQFTDDVRASLNQFANEVGRSSFELEEMASTIQDTFVPMGFARGEAADLSVQLAKLATDVASFNNASDAETMRAFQSALVGNHETVRRFGVVITEATIQQELMRMGINKLSKDASNQEKVQARLNILLRGTTDAQGDAARTSTSFANQMKGLSGELQNLGVSVITPLMPTLAKFIGSLKDSVRGVRDLLYSIGILRNDIMTSSGLTAELIMLQGELLDLENARQKRGNHAALVKAKKEEIALIESQIEEVRKFNKLAADQALAEEKEARMKAEKASAIQNINMAIEEQRKKQEFLNKQLSLGTDAEREAVKVISEHASSFAKLGDGGSELEKTFMDLLIANEKLEQSLSETTDITDVITERFDNAKSIVESLKTPLEEITENIADLKFAQSEFTTDEFNRAMREMDLQMRLTNPQFVAVKEAVEDMGNKVSDSLAEMLTSGKANLTSFLDIFKDFVKQLLAQTIRLAIINRAINSILGVRGTSAQLDEIPINGLAGGGTVQRGRPYMVGERGPEMFVPNTGGRIVSNGALPTGGATTVVNQNLNFSTGIQNTVRAEVLNMLPAIQQSTLQAVVDQKRRGGSFGQLMS